VIYVAELVGLGLTTAWKNDKFFRLH
jgi:hypothetical protein